jgi:hypothetical protein
MPVFSSCQFAWTYVTPSGVASRGHVLTHPQIMIIGLMHLSNPMVYTQFHPVAYMVKLNIEMTMASLIKKIAQATVSEREGRSMGQHTYEYAGNEITHPASTYQNGIHTTASARPRMPSNAANHYDLDLDLDLDLDCIRTTKEVQVRVENAPSRDDDKDSDLENGNFNRFDRRPHDRGGVTMRRNDDELTLSSQDL